MEPPTPPQKRKASVAYASSPAKRARAISFSVKVSHESAPINVVGDPEIPVIPENPQACLVGIPEELLSNVIQNFDDDRDTLAKLCRTDRRCKRIAEALLYKKVQGSWYFNKNGQTERISRDTALAKNTKLAWFAFGPELPSWKTDYQPLARTDLVRALSNVSNIQEISITEHMKETIDRSRVAQQLGWLDLLEKAVLGAAGSPQNSFAQLKTLSISTTRLSIAEISFAFRLPALDRLHLEGVYQSTPIEAWSIPEASCNITSLSLVRAFANTETVVKIITSMKALRLFRFHRDTSSWGQRVFEDGPTATRPVHSWTLLGDALRSHKLSLEELFLLEYVNEEMEPIDHPDNRGIGTLGSFQDFPRLTSVKCAIKAFLDVHAGEKDLSVYLPPQLKYLATELPLTAESTMASYASVLASLQKVLCAQPERRLVLMIDEYLPYQQLRLSESLQPLETAGISINIMDSTYCNVLTLDHLRARERGESDSNDESDEESEQDDEAEEDSEEEEEEEEDPEKEEEEEEEEDDVED
jgi:hypothetical protein